jgi:cyd operon protein YbgT
MWYFAWLLGLPLACMFAVLNAMWLELRETDAGATIEDDPQGHA